MDQLKVWLTTEVMGNELWRVLVLLGGVLGGLIAGKLSRYFLEKAGTEHGGTGPAGARMFQALGKGRAPALALGWAFARHDALVLPERFADWAASGMEVLGILAVGYVSRSD